MRFVLHYRGPLRSNGDAHHKHEIRAALSVQLRKLWGQSPLSDIPQWVQPRSLNWYCFLHEVAGFQFVPLVTSEVNAIAEPQVVMLRPSPPGELLSHGGDLDNRLKTLFDALTIPQGDSQIGNCRFRVYGGASESWREVGCSRAGAWQARRYMVAIRPQSARGLLLFDSNRPPKGMGIA